MLESIINKKKQDRACGWYHNCRFAGHRWHKVDTALTLTELTSLPRLFGTPYGKLFKNYLIRPQSQSYLYDTIYNFRQTFIDRIKTSKYLSHFLWPWPKPKGKVTWLHVPYSLPQHTSLGDSVVYGLHTKLYIISGNRTSIWLTLMHIIRIRTRM